MVAYIALHCIAILLDDIDIIYIYFFYIIVIVLSNKIQLFPKISCLIYYSVLYAIILYIMHIMHKYDSL